MPCYTHTHARDVDARSPNEAATPKRLLAYRDKSCSSRISEDGNILVNGRYGSFEHVKQHTRCVVLRSSALISARAPTLFFSRQP